MYVLLAMKRKDFEGLPEIHLPEGYEIRTYQPGDEEAWVEIVRSGIVDWTPERCRQELIDKPQFLPDGLFFITHEGEPVGTACAFRDAPDQWTEGYLHMVCVVPEHRGKRLGYMITLAVLHYFKDRGFKHVILQTDDFRIPAIKAYLRLGFEPFMTHDNHPERWEILMRQDEFLQRKSPCEIER